MKRRREEVEEREGTVMMILGLWELCSKLVHYAILNFLKKPSLCL